MIYMLSRKRCDEIPNGIFSIITKLSQGQLVYHFLFLWVWGLFCGGGVGED